MVWPTQKVEAICDISVLVEHLKCTPTKNLFESWVIGCCSIYPPGTFAPRDGCELSQLGSSDPKACRPRESKPGRLRTFTGTWWNMVKRIESETQIILWYEEVHKDQDLETYLRPWKKNIVFIGQGGQGYPVEGLHTFRSLKILTSVPRSPCLQWCRSLPPERLPYPTVSTKNLEVL